MPDRMSWSGVLQDNARNFADKHACIALLDEGTTEDSLTYSELWTAARQIGFLLTDSLPRQSHILILLPQDLNFIKAFLSCLLTGMVAVPVYLPNNGKQVQKVHNIFTDAQPRAVLWSKSSTPGLWRDLHDHNACQGALWIDIDDVATTQLSAEVDISPNDLAMLQYTSGSTGNPKGVMLTHRNLLANEEMIRDAFEHTDETIVVGCLPFYHDMGLIGNILQPLYLGATCIFLSALQVVRQPLSWLRSISQYRATTSGGPNAYYELCINRIDAAADFGDLDLSCWKVAFNGSEPVRSSTLEAFARKFSRYGFRKSAFLPVYGLAEASLLVTGRRKATLPTVVTLDRNAYENSRVLPQDEHTSRPVVQIVGCGLPASGVEVAILSEQGQRVQEGEIGEILVSSASVARGYWNSQFDDVFEVQVAGSHEGARFLRTGDRGFLFGGELFVTGRAKELMIVRGRNYYPADIEKTAAAACTALAGCRNAAFSLDVAASEGIVIVQEVTAKAAKDYEGICRAISQQCWLEHEIHLLDVVPVRIGTIPRTTSGKTRRLLTKELYRGGRLLAVGKADDRRETALDIRGYELLRTCLTAKFRDYFPGHGEKIDVDTPLSSLGLDSYSVVRISDEISHELGIAVPLIEFVKRNTIDELARHIVESRGSCQMRRAATRQPERRTMREKFRQSHGQIALWNREKMTGHQSALTVSRLFQVNKGLDWEAFEAAVASLMSQCDVLRTTLQDEDGELVQMVVADRKPSIAYVDAADWDEYQAARFLEEKANAKLDIANGETWRWFLLNRPNGSLILLTFHHIICDLETLNILVEALFKICSANEADRIEPLDRYSHYVEWQHGYLESEEGRYSGLFWSDTLKDVDLKLDIIRKKGQQFGVEEAAGIGKLTLGYSQTEELMRKSREAGVGLNALLLAAFAVVLKRYTNQTKYAVGIPVSARTHAMFRRTLGYMVNVLPIVADFSMARHFEHIVQQIQERTLEALEHQQYPLPLVIQQYRRSHNEAAHEIDLLNVVFTYQKSILSDGQDTTAFAMNEASSRATVIGDVELHSLPLKVHEIEFPLTMTAGVIEGSLRTHLQWNTRVMYEDVMSSMLESYGNLLADIIGCRDLRAVKLN